MSEKFENKISPEKHEQKLDLDELKNLFEKEGDEFTFDIYSRPAKADLRGNYSKITNIESSDEIRAYRMKIFKEGATARHISPDSGDYYVNLSSDEKHDRLSAYHPLAGPVTFLSMTETKNGGNVKLYNEIETSSREMIQWLEKLTTIIKNENLKELANEYEKNNMEIWKMICWTRDIEAENKAIEILHDAMQTSEVPTSDGVYDVINYDYDNTNRDDTPSLDYVGRITIKDKKIMSSSGVESGDAYIPLYGPNRDIGFYYSQENAKKIKEIKDTVLPEGKNIIDNLCKLVGRNAEIEKEIFSKIETEK